MFLNVGDFVPRPSMGDGAHLLAGFASALSEQLMLEIEAIAGKSPFRHLTVPGGHEMSVAMTNCGDVGWISDRSGYRYDPLDPQTKHPWPVMPKLFRQLALDAAASAGFASFEPDACLINRYAVGSKMGLHQDKDETNFAEPIVSVSLGLPATFVFGGLKRSDPTVKVPVFSGDVIVFGGPARLKFHGVLTIREGSHLVCGAHRYNLTFRRAK